MERNYIAATYAGPKLIDYAISRYTRIMASEAKKEELPQKIKPIVPSYCGRHVDVDA